MAKRWFQSKTIWWNLLVFLVAALFDKPLSLPTMALLLMTSIVNLILRFATEEKCTI